MTKRVYLTQRTEISGKSYEPNNIYTLSAIDSKRLIEAGQAEAVNLASIDAIAQKADLITENFVTKRKELLESDRYADNETERAYLLTELNVNTAREIEDIEFSYQAEIMASKQFAAGEALKAVGTEEEQAQAIATASAIQTQILIAGSAGGVVELLRLSARNFDDATKIEVLKILPGIKEQAGDAHSGTIQAIEKDLRKFNSAGDHQKQLRHLKAMENSTTQIATKYHQAKLLQGAKL